MLKLRAPYSMIRNFESGPNQCSVCNETKPKLELVELEPFYPVQPSYPDTQPNFHPRVRICSDCLPTTKYYFAEVAKCFETLNHFWPECAKRWVETDHAINYNNIDWGEAQLPLSVTQIVRDARHSFLFGFFTASIATISAAVELAINLDTRIKESDEDEAWQNLNMDLLLTCKLAGINVDDLLEEGEKLPGKKIKFLCRRNRYAHGDVREWNSGQNPFINTEFMQQEAGNQLLLGQEFIRNWAASEGNQEMNRSDKRLELRAYSNVLNLKFYNPFAS